MTYGWLFVTFGIPAVTPALADPAARGKDRVARHLDPPAGE
ncbi:hypothetical protein [Methylobacterium mesophilicum]|nr:hypothetical protein [Methylobacterium mesophilicum]